MIKTHSSGLLATLALASSVLLTACGGSSSDDNNAKAPEAPAIPQESGVCGQSGEGINHEALMSKNCEYLSSYRLFADHSNPTAEPAAGGIPYDLSTALFSDYTSKYRFVFVPEGEQAQYSENEAFDFPVGTVITKTFSLPASTAFRGFDNETMLETRLLIRRASGWTALPYVWDKEGKLATFKAAGAFLDVSTTHNGQQFDFTYEVPDTNMCKQCHQFNTADSSLFTPIGPKARLLNKEYNYAGGTENQLAHWEAAGILEALPSDLTTIATVPGYEDSDEPLLASRSDDELMDLAKGYLDINCAHCHRPEGGASNTALHLEFWRSYENNKTNHGRCKTPLAYTDRSGNDLKVDLVPGNAEQSILHARMNTVKPRERMPEIGRSLVHQEGVALVASWIDSLPGDCNPSSN
ncbi:MAG: SO2930 family diheme c-type cytochrome [Marinobacter sp.]